MPFVQPLFLWVALGVAIPIIVHLMFRRRSRRVPLGTLRFLKVVLHENARRRRLKQLALLALRCAAVVLLAAMFARPFIPALGGGLGKERFVAVLIDRSASMQLADRGTRLLDQAVAAARDIVRQGDRGTEVQVAYFDHAVEPQSGGKGQQPSAIDVETPDAAFGATNYGAALAWARDVCIKSPHRLKQVYLFTDLQRSGLDWSDADVLPEDVEFHLEDLGRPVNNNVAVVGIQTSKTVVRPGDSVMVTATVLNGGPFPLEKRSVVLSLSQKASRQTLRQSINLEPGASGTVDFEVPPLPAGLWQGTVKIDVDDELTFDNERHLAVLAQPPMPVVLVDGDPQGSSILSETYFLDIALRLAPPGQLWTELPFAPSVASVSSIETLPDLSKSRIVVLANVGSLPASDLKRLSAFVNDGGGLVVFTGDNVQKETVAALNAAGLGPGELLGEGQTSDLPWRLSSWNEKHSLFSLFNDPQHGDLRRLAFRTYSRIEPAKTASVLARFQNDEPAVVEVAAGKGKVLWFLSACDREWSDWPRSRLYVPVIYQMMFYLTGWTEGGPIRESLLDTMGTTTADRPGVHAREGYSEVVNVSPRESEMERCTAEDFSKRFELKLHQQEKPAEAVQTAAASFATELRDDEAWPWVNACLVLVLLAEVFLANRTMV